MIITHSIMLNGSQYWTAAPSSSMFLSAVRNTYGECCNITKLETSYTAWWGMIIEVSYLSRYNVAVF